MNVDLDKSSAVGLEINANHLRAKHEGMVTATATPFHVGTPGEIRYEVTGVTGLAGLAYSSTDGEIEVGAVMGPAPAVGVVRLTYGRPGTYTTTLKATTMVGTTLQASVIVNVVE